MDREKEAIVDKINSYEPFEIVKVHCYNCGKLLKFKIPKPIICNLIRNCDSCGYILEISRDFR